jgi:molybdate/tungstate transport system ATP-binding protein
VIVVENLSIQAGAFSLERISFEVPRGEYAVLMGKTGSGKTTLLESICGLRRIAAGRILLQQKDVTRLRPADRGIGYVPQDRALFPSMTVRQNLAFSLAIRRWDKERAAGRVEELAALLGIQKLLNRGPQGLSAGEAQRVALGRALAYSPGLLFLDEPLSALDEATRHDMHALLRSVREHTGVTVLHVTHSHSEAQVLATRLLLLDNGAVTQQAL